VKALASLKELAPGRRARPSTPGRDASAEYVDEQIAQLLETIEADARAPHVPERESAATKPPPTPVLHRLRGRWEDVCSGVAYLLLGTVIGILIGALIGR
jgi:hypothetical protein